MGEKSGEGEGDVVVVSGVVVSESEKAWLIKVSGGKNYWFPKSLVEGVGDCFEMPRWLWEKNVKVSGGG